MYVSSRKKDRVEWYRQYIRFLTQAKGMIGYTAASAEEMLEHTGGVPLLEPLVRSALLSMREGRSFEESWNGAAVLTVGNQEDRELLCTFGRSFGTGDVSAELSKLSLHLENVRQAYDRLSEEYRASRRVCRTVGTFCGVLAAVLLV